jgi:membrane-associated phospholipid phosphatase
MSEPIPMLERRVAVWVGRIFHPYWFPIPTLLLLLHDYPLGERLGWILLILGILLMPVMAAALILKRQGHLAYQRQPRTPLYMVGGLSLIVCSVVLLALQAPAILLTCLLTLVVWLPIQAAVNHWLTKISAHAAVASGCFFGLLVTGALSSPLLLAIGISVVVLTVWARLDAHYHTPVQIALGLVVGAVPVLIVFPLRATLFVAMS